MKAADNNNGTLTIRSCHAVPACMECRQDGRRKAALNAEADLGRSVLFGSRGTTRDRALFDLAIDSKLRGCDLVKIKIGTLVSGPDIRTRAIVIQQKTGRPVQFELTADVTSKPASLAGAARRHLDDYAFPSRVDPAGHLEHAPICSACR